MDITNSWILGVAFYYFINVFAKNYVVINCLIELIRFIVYNVTTYTPANFEFLTNSTGGLHGTPKNKTTLPS